VVGKTIAVPYLGRVRWSRAQACCREWQHRLLAWLTHWVRAWR